MLVAGSSKPCRDSLRNFFVGRLSGKSVDFILLQTHHILLLKSGKASNMKAYNNAEKVQGGDATMSHMACLPGPIFLLIC
jgi:hypothetical protein